MNYPRVFLKPGREKPAASGRHPWVFSGAIKKVKDAVDGDIVDVCAADGSFIGRGYYNSRSQITVRFLTFGSEKIDGDFFRRRLRRAINLRKQLGLNFHQPAAATTAFRLINAEADFLPGLIVDVYGDQLVLQSLTLGMEKQKTAIIEALSELLLPAGVFERSDAEVRAKEGLEPSCGLLWGQEPPEKIDILENGHHFLVDLRQGHKTGMYLDQRESRAQLRELALRLKSTDSRRLLNCFSYSGGFGVYAAKADPNLQVRNVDASASALELAQQNFAANNLSQQGEFVRADVFSLLTQYQEAKETFDVIILDPPKFAFRKDNITSACRGYQTLNRLGFSLLRPGGYLLTFSCSGLISPELFQKVVFAASTEANRDAQLVYRLGQAPDHPLLLSFPEGEYLKGFMLHCPQ